MRLASRLRGVLESAGSGSADGVMPGLMIELAQRVLALNERLAVELARAYSDELTGLLGRSAFLEAAARQADAGPEACIVLLDLDRFKAVNDTYGHAAGDTVLRATALRLHDWCHASGSAGVAGRLGGDEFVAVVRMSTPARLSRRLARLRQLIERQVPFEGLPLCVGASIGCVRIEGGDVRSALRTADQLMYADKRGRRPQAA